MTQILLEGLEFYSYHGCFSEEQIIGTWFTVDLTLEGDFEKSAINDDLHETVNYLQVYRTVKEEMEKPSKLIETVANRIIEAVLQKFVLVENIKVKVSKLNPPLGGKIKNVSVIMQKNRPIINKNLVE